EGAVDHALSAERRRRLRDEDVRAPRHRRRDEGEAQAADRPGADPAGGRQGRRRTRRLPHQRADRPRRRARRPLPGRAAAGSRVHRSGRGGHQGSRRRQGADRLSQDTRGGRGAQGQGHDAGVSAVDRRGFLLAAAGFASATVHAAGAAAQTAGRAFMISASSYDTSKLLHYWRWLVPQTETPLLLSALGDWVFGRPDGSLAKLDLLEGRYTPLARTSDEFNKLKATKSWLEKEFSYGWFEIALVNKLIPSKDECIGWKIAPVLGGKFTVANLQLFDMAVYQVVQGQLHQQLQNKGRPRND